MGGAGGGRAAARDAAIYELAGLIFLQYHLKVIRDQALSSHKAKRIANVMKGFGAQGDEASEKKKLQIVQNPGGGVSITSL